MFFVFPVLLRIRRLDELGRDPETEARVFIGVDSARSQYVVHWLDRFGAAASIPHAIGTARGDTIMFTFPYRSGEFRDTFVYRRESDSWYFRLEAADPTEGWRLFAEYQVHRRR
jgi:hypothetical protein